MPTKVRGDGCTRRELVLGGLKTFLLSSALRSLPGATLDKEAPLRSVNIINFIRAEEPREKIDLMLPLRKQMEIIKTHHLPATWLLQYDALVEGPFIEFLKAEMPPDHETGIWFEMNRRLCDDAGVDWRGNPLWEWDYHVPVAYVIGYTPEERRRLADTAMAAFKRIIGHNARSIACWNLDGTTIAHLAEHYEVDAFANCRDQIATDGYTIWGAPIAAYYPSRNNAWSPALETKNQIATPMFRLLGQDPVYYYDNRLPQPDTMEPVWPSGQSEVFVERFFNMIANGPTQSLAYAQLGQENSFGWPMMSQAFPMQMEKLSQTRQSGGLIVETMGSTGRLFKQRFRSTPSQAQVMLEDPFDHKSPAERTVWYQSKYLRANLHFCGNQFYLRDLHVYSDAFPQLYLTDPVRKHGIEQRMLAVLDGYHWSDDQVRKGHAGRRAVGRFAATGQHGKSISLTMAGVPAVSETKSTLRASVPLAGGGEFVAEFGEREIEFRLAGGKPHTQLALIFEWARDRSTLQGVTPNLLTYRFRDFNYTVQIQNGSASQMPDGVTVLADPESALRLKMAQSA